MYEEARAVDERESKHFYKLVKYVMAKTAEGKSDRVVQEFNRKYKLELIEIPEEFKDLSIDDYQPKSMRSELLKPKTIRVYTRTNKSLVDYDVWRTFDRNLVVPTGKHPAVCKLMIPPALLKRAFGSPGKTQIGFAGTGTYDFEDTNLDLYRLIDYKQTDFYHGPSREDEFYLTEKNMKKPLHKRTRKWPTIDEFWACEDPKPFRLIASEAADYRKFRRWIR